MKHNNNNDTFYFLAYPSGEKDKITVIDLAYCVDYERSDWCNVNDMTFYSHTEAINYARNLAKKHGLKYVLFESRYDHSLNEDDIKNDYLYL